jgi:hypothetical protein
MKVGFGVGLALVGLVLVWNGFAALTVEGSDGGYELTDPLTISVSSRAVVSNDVELLRGDYQCYSDLTPIYWFYSTPDEVRVRGVATGSETLFMGIAPADAAARYLDGVVHDEITIEWDCFGFATEIEDEDVVYTRIEGTAYPAAPGTEGFWVASVSGSGEQTLDWTIQSGEWALVIMNADGSPGVSADVQLGVQVPSGFGPIGLASLVVGLPAATGGILLMLPSRLISPLPFGPDETPRWTFRGRSVLPTTREGRIAVLCVVLSPIPLVVFGAPIALFLAVRKGDRSLLLVLPLAASIVAAMVPFVVVLSILVPLDWAGLVVGLVAVIGFGWLVLRSERQRRRVPPGPPSGPGMGVAEPQDLVDN